MNDIDRAIIDALPSRRLDADDAGAIRASLTASGFAIVPTVEHNARNRAVAALDSHLYMEELKLAEKHCEWPAFKHAFSAVMKHRRENVAMLSTAKEE